MKWSKCTVGGYVSPTAIQSDAGHLLCRSPQEGFVRDGRVCYTLSKHGNIIASEWCDDNDEARELTRRKLMELADE